MVKGAITVEVTLKNGSATTISFSSLNKLNSLFHRKSPEWSSELHSDSARSEVHFIVALPQFTVFSHHHERKQTSTDDSSP